MNELIEEFFKLVAKHDRMWKRITDDLNNQGITRSTGQQWTEESTERFYRKHCSENRQRVIAKTLPPLTQTLPVWMDGAALEDLRMILEEWRNREIIPMKEIQPRPVFKGKRRNSGFHVNDEILRRAADKVKKDKVRTGGSLSMLVELLLWQYIGSPEDLLEQ